MKIRTNIKSGAITANHNEKINGDDNVSMESKKTFVKKLRLNKETIRELKESDLKKVAGGDEAEACPSIRASCLPTCNTCY